VLSITQFPPVLRIFRGSLRSSLQVKKIPYTPIPPRRFPGRSTFTPPSYHPFLLHFPPRFSRCWNLYLLSFLHCPPGEILYPRLPGWGTECTGHGLQNPRSVVQHGSPASSRGGIGQLSDLKNSSWPVLILVLLPVPPLQTFTPPPRFK